jgi:TRAP-type mannitol/chloroaromatic compound transport system substrate-binding protein
MSNRAALVAVITAFLVGVVSSLALRPAPKPLRTGDAVRTTELRWRVPTAFGTNLPALGDNALEVSRRIDAASGGRLRLEVFEPGEIVPAFAIVDAVREGKVQAGYTWLGYDQGKLPASVLFGAVPFGMSPWEYSAWWYDGEGRALAREVYGKIGIHPLLCGLIGPETAGWFREPLEQASDVEGLKIRFAGLGGKAIQRLGASVTMLPGGEIFQALEKGAIDATEFSLPVVDQRLGFDRVAGFNYFPGWHQPSTAFHLVIGVEEWKALAAESRALIESACTAGVTRNLARAEALQGPVLRDFEERGVQTRTLSREILLALKRESDAVLEEEARDDADFARVLASQRAFSDDYDVWRRIAYPPRP